MMMPDRAAKSQPRSEIAMVAFRASSAEPSHAGNFRVSELSAAPMARCDRRGASSRFWRGRLVGDVAWERTRADAERSSEAARATLQKRDNFALDVAASRRLDEQAS
jgi:hypothetical protein